MAKIFRFSGYFVDGEKIPYSTVGFKVNLTEPIVEESKRSIFQQFHIEESEEFELDGENKENCDLALLTRHFKKDNSNMQFDRPLPTKGEKYKHFKLGKIVTVIGLSRHTETEEITVVYEYEGTIWNRPLEMFMSEVDKEKYPNVSQKYRFEKVGERMTLDEAIAHAREVAKRQRDAQIKYFGRLTCDSIEKLNKCEKEHEQLAEWLEDYKRLKAERPARANRIRRIWCYGYDKGVADVMSKVKELQEKNLKECKKYDD